MSRLVRRIIFGVVLVLIIVLAWFFLLNPIRSDIAAMEQSIEDERTSLAAGQAQLAQAEATREEGAANRGRLLELAKMVPQGEQMPSLLLQIQDLAEQSGIEFIAVTPGAPMQSGDFDMVPLGLEFTGTYFDVSDFVYRAEQMVAGPGRLLAVKDIDLQLGQESEESASSGVAVSPNLDVNMTIYAFEMATAAAGEPQAPSTGSSSSGGSTAPGSSSGETTTSTTTGGS